MWCGVGDDMKSDSTKFNYIYVIIAIGFRKLRFLMRVLGFSGGACTLFSLAFVSYYFLSLSLSYFVLAGFDCFK